MIAVGEMSWIVAAWSVNRHSDLLQESLLVGGQGDNRCAGIELRGGPRPDSPAAGGGKTANLAFAILHHGAFGEDWVFIGQANRPEEVEQEMGVLLVDHDQ